MTNNTKNLVVIGGGTGLSVILKGLKKENFNLTAIVTVADDGGSSGKLRSELDMLPPGDIRNVLISLANTEPLLEKLLQHRFKQGEGLAGHNVGNLLIAAMQEITGDFVLAVKELSRVLAVKGQVLPATLQQLVLTAEYVDGTFMKGESNIPTQSKEIKRVFIEPSNAEPLIDAVEAIEAADAILIGPGSLYTSIIPNLLVKGLINTITKSKAKKIYISNLMTQPGETDNYTVIDHVKAIEEHAGGQFFEYIIAQCGNIPPEIIEKYKLKGATPVIVDEELLSLKRYKVITENFVTYSTYLRHDTEKLTKILSAII